MGTRHITRVFDDRGTEILCCYGQWDGYPEGYGHQLAALIALRTNTHGAGLAPNARATGTNGMECLAALIVAHFKRDMEAGNFYVYAPGSKDCGEEFEYQVRANEFRCLKVTCAYDSSRKTRTLFKGEPAAFAAKYAPKAEGAK